MTRPISDEALAKVREHVEQHAKSVRATFTIEAIAGLLARLDKAEATARRPATVSEASRKTGFSRKRLGKAIALGEVKTIVFAGDVLIPPGEVDRMLREVAEHD
jgi:hypothetical protein